MTEDELRAALPRPWSLDAASSDTLRIRASRCLSGPDLRADGWKLRHIEDDLRVTKMRDARESAVSAAYRVTHWSAEIVSDAFRVYEESFRERPGFPGWPAERWLAWATDHEAFRPDLSCLVLEGERPVAFAVSALEDTRADGGEREAWVAQMGVLPAARRRGIGRLLLEQVRSSAVQADASALLLSVNENNPGARALYNAFGFEFARRRAVYEQARASTS